MKKLMAMVLLVFANDVVLAETTSLTLDLPTMTCAVCPITVSRALKKVPGVNDVEVTFETRKAKIVFDNQQTGVTALIEATTLAGYPSTLVE